MAREVYVWDEIKGRVVLREERTPKPSKSAHVISDAMPALKHMGTGVVSDSKSHHRLMTKRIGAVEVGTDPAARRAPPPIDPPFTEYVEAVKRAIQESNR